MIPVTADTAADAAKTLAAFLAEYPAAEVKIKPAMVKGNRCLALHYIDARLVMDRLDEVVGIAGWKDEYTVLADGTEVECRLSVRIAGEWITKADVGGESEQPDGGDRMKAAYSDALKRAAVKFGIGRYLYRLPQQWMDYDPVKKQIVRPGTTQQQPKPAAGQPQQQSPRDAAAADLRGCRTRDQYMAVCVRIGEAVKAGRLTAADRDALAPVAREVGAKFPEPQPAAK